MNKLWTSKNHLHFHRAVRGQQLPDSCVDQPTGRPLASRTQTSPLRSTHATQRRLLQRLHNRHGARCRARRPAFPTPRLQRLLLRLHTRRARRARLGARIPRPLRAHSSGLGRVHRFVCALLLVRARVATLLGHAVAISRGYACFQPYRSLQQQVVRPVSNRHWTQR